MLGRKPNDLIEPSRQQTIEFPSALDETFEWSTDWIRHISRRCLPFLSAYRRDPRHL